MNHLVLNGTFVSPGVLAEPIHQLHSSFVHAPGVLAKPIHRCANQFPKIPFLNTVHSGVGPSTLHFGRSNRIVRLFRETVRVDRAAAKSSTSVQVR
uniref:Putative secreted protein n=1 Tax=Anopheles triannulatus TaxID=58253 RepID=A0A2M4B4E0_9DIPT